MVCGGGNTLTGVLTNACFEYIYESNSWLDTGGRLQPVSGLVFPGSDYHREWGMVVTGGKVS